MLNNQFKQQSVVSLFLFLINYDKKLRTRRNLNVGFLKQFISTVNSAINSIESFCGQNRKHSIVLHLDFDIA